MSMNNPRMKNVDRSAYELPVLLQALGEPNHAVRLSEDQRNIVDAIHIHARNAQEVILDGIASIGHLMTTVDDTMEVSRHDLLGLGSLLKHLAHEADYLRGAQADMISILQSDEERQANKKGTRA